MATPVVTVASGGLAVVDVTASTPKLGLPVTEALNGRGIAITKVAANGLPVTYSTVADYPAGGGGATTYATWDSATVTAVTLSGGNLVATNTGTTSTSQGAHGAAASGKTSGKYYYECAFMTIAGGGGANLSLGIGTTASTYAAMGNNATTGVTLYIAGGIWTGGSSSGVALGSRVAGHWHGIAVDLDNRKIWLKDVTSGGNWNNSGTADPVTNVGGITIPAGTMVPFALFGGIAGTANNVITSNFGASAFSGAVPVGFTSGWPA